LRKIARGEELDLVKLTFTVSLSVLEHIETFDLRLDQCVVARRTSLGVLD
jgi:hypothetical protein